MDVIARCSACLLLMVLAACASPAPPVASPAPPAAQGELVIFREIGGRITQAHQMGNVLSELLALQALLAEYEQNASARSVIGQIIAAVLAEAGDYAGAHRAFDRAEPIPLVTSQPTLDGQVPVDAFEAIAEAAGSAQVILINEAHHVPQHRAFTLQLLGALRQKGFTHFAAETLFADPELAERGYPTPKTGWYSSEPLYGDLIRTALRQGYRVVHYEPEPVPGQGLPVRERGQAANLVERTLKENPQAKVLVHLGYSHNDERTAGPIRWMATYFTEMTGIDPLTINQYAMTERSTPEREEPAYRWATEHGLVPRPVVFRDGAGKLWSGMEGNDVMVFHPRSTYEHGRPTWLRMGGLRSPHPLQEDVCGAAPRCLVQARFANEGEDAIPVDQVIVEAGKPVPALMLPEGSFVFRTTGV
jgi:hypothetical protein